MIVDTFIICLMFRYWILNAFFIVSIILMTNVSLEEITNYLEILFRALKKIFLIVSKPFILLAKIIYQKYQAKKERLNNSLSNEDEEEDEEEDEIEEDNNEDETEEDIEETEKNNEEDIVEILDRHNLSKNKAPNLLHPKNNNLNKSHTVQKTKPRKKRVPMVNIPLDLLNNIDQKPSSKNIEQRQQLIHDTFGTFGIDVEMGEVAIGPTVTQFTFKPVKGIKLNRITSLHNDLALALAAHPIRIEAPIPGKSLVGIEVPNQSVAIVGLRDVLKTKKWKQNKKPLSFALGQDVSGQPWVASIAKMPHLLVAGATGSGKSVALNTLIMSLLYSYGPDDLKLILVDPKRVEFPIYNNIPHLITPVITGVEETINALKWAVREMNRRFDLLSKVQARDIATYNKRTKDKIPYLVMVIDELADLMVANKQEVETHIVRLAQMSRAVGIHLVLATQRPSVDVITGLIKANIPARMAFSVASLMDSRTILDQSGAEKLIGRGDMLFLTAELSSPKRIQGVFISDEEITRVVDFIKSSYDPADYDDSVTESDRSDSVFSSNGKSQDKDAKLMEAKEVILQAGKASASLLQRRLSVGYARAARIIDILEEEGFIGPSNGSKPREILKHSLEETSSPPEVDSYQEAYTEDEDESEYEESDEEEEYNEGDEESDNEEEEYEEENDNEEDEGEYNEDEEDEEEDEESEEEDEEEEF